MGIKWQKASDEEMARRVSAKPAKPASKKGAKAAQSTEE